MKILHLSDLHLGKRVNEFSMTEEQEYVLSQVLDIIDAEKPEAVFLQVMYMINLSLRRKRWGFLMIFCIRFHSGVYRCLL